MLRDQPVYQLQNSNSTEICILISYGMLRLNSISKFTNLNWYFIVQSNVVVFSIVFQIYYLLSISIPSLQMLLYPHLQYIMFEDPPLLPEDINYIKQPKKHSLFAQFGSLSLKIQIFVPLKGKQRQKCSRSIMRGYSEDHFNDLQNQTQPSTQQISLELANTTPLNIERSLRQRKLAVKKIDKKHRKNMWRQLVQQFKNLCLNSEYKNQLVSDVEAFIKDKFLRRKIKYQSQINYKKEEFLEFIRLVDRRLEGSFEIYELISQLQRLLERKALQHEKYGFYLFHLLVAVDKWSKSL